jgi:hypothetical protein
VFFATKISDTGQRKKSGFVRIAKATVVGKICFGNFYFIFLRGEGEIFFLTTLFDILHLDTLAGFEPTAVSFTVFQVLGLRWLTYITYIKELAFSVDEIPFLTWVRSSAPGYLFHTWECSSILGNIVPYLGM